jgi:hypothetical protein
MNQQPNGFIPVPVINMQQGGNDFSSREENTPPARILVGLRFLDYLMRKVDTKVAVNDISIDPIPGIKPTKEETLTHDACCVMLGNYFKGKLAPDEQERFRRKANREFTDPISGRNRGILMGCPICVGSTGQVHPRCQLCGGEGKILAQRFSGD